MNKIVINAEFNTKNQNQLTTKLIFASKISERIKISNNRRTIVLSV